MIDEFVFAFGLVVNVVFDYILENLHLTYTEVMEVIPYRNLVIMQKDKLHTASGEVMKEVSDAEMFKNRKFDE